MDIYIQIAGDKMIKITDENQTAKEVLKKYLDKGAMHVYLTLPDYQKLTTKIKEYMAQREIIKAESSTPQEKIADLDRGFALIRQLFTSLEINPETFNYAKKANDSTIEFIRSVKSVRKFFDQFLKNCSAELIESLMTSYFVCAIIDQFPWKSDTIKQKASLGILLCDMSLDYQDFMEIKRVDNNKNKLPKKILEHPQNMVNHLQACNVPVSLETITLILQHHEKQDGTGYPHGISHTHITILSSIHIITRLFVNQLIACQFNMSEKSKILNLINEQYNEGNFKKAFQGLRDVVAKEEL
jgi:hypothetical protein